MPFDLLSFVASIANLPFLVVGTAGSIGVLGGALALGIRHGMDWDHIAAITDITSTTAANEPETHEPQAARSSMVMNDHHVLAAVAGGASGSVAFYNPSVSQTVTAPQPPAFLIKQRRSLTLGTLYALGHGTMVVVLGLIAIVFSEILPAWIDPIMERVVGVTLLFLGVYLLYSLYRYLRQGGEFRIRSRWMLVFTVVKRAWHRVRSIAAPAHAHPHPPADDSQQYGAATSYGIGLIHGIGAETGTQVLIIGTAVGAASTGMSIATLFVFVFGLLLSNSFITVVTATGFVSAGQRQTVYVIVGAIAAVFSLGLGVLYLTSSGSILPDLDPYFRWVGGPAA